ncbi:hemolysin [Tyzzerella sp. An114]|uniref:PAQR family membrane homeostasis protein TrhA n=1 Tax=Tyzzerella sp. An114 TaxID=1965545 RepID=UPI000B44033A|nr:hemolysin III family protein [Tyzzerella sp. An114]OUQ59668.1 hemolysin [Tyzzerella sp. An114]
MSEIIEKKVKDPISAFTHFLGFLMSIPVTITLVYKSLEDGNFVASFAFLIFGVSLMLLYGASTIYHTVKTDERHTAILRRIDHIMIFVLIAGTYTPVCLVPLRGKWGYTLLAIVWGIAFLGIFLKIFWLNAPRFLSTAIYVAMGWLVMIAFMPLEKALPLGGIILLALGGVTYTVGAIIYAFKSKRLQFKYVNFHDIFHLFVMGGSFFHIVFMYVYIL